MDIMQWNIQRLHQKIGRFNERFILSLASCQRCLVVDDSLHILPLSSHSFELRAAQSPPVNEELKEIKAQLQDTQPVGSLVNNCVTVDQVRLYPEKQKNTGRGEPFIF